MIRNIFDFDGVTTLGLNPGPNDLIITGRTVDETAFVLSYLQSRNLMIPVFFNPTTIQTRGRGTEACRLNSAMHKATTIVQLVRNGVMVGNIFEDDPIQFKFLLEWFSMEDNHDVLWLTEQLVRIDHSRGDY